MKRLRSLKKRAKELPARIRLLAETDRIEDVADEIRGRKVELRAAKAEVERIESLEPAPEPSKKQLAWIGYALGKFPVIYAKLLTAERQRLFEICFSSMVWHGTHIVLTCRGKGPGGGDVEVVVPYLPAGQVYGTDRFWERLPTGMILEGEGPRRQSRVGGCSIPGCGKAIHARRLCGVHYGEAMGGYPDHGKRSKILPDAPEEVLEPLLRTSLGHPKITEAIAKEIRAKYEAGGTSYRKLAKEYGISHSRVQQIVRGDAWKA